MATKMEMAELQVVSENFPGAQKVAVLNKPYDMTIRYAEVPEPADGEIRVRIKWVGICGSDVEAYRGNRRPEFMSIPARLGHEAVGIIDKLGLNVSCLKVGDPVVCRYVWGALAQFIICRPCHVAGLPPDIPLVEASIIEILPSIIHTAELAQVGAGKNVLITGQGVSGLVMTQVVRLYGPKNLAVTDLRDRNLELARKYGATHTYRIPSPETPTMGIVGKDFREGFDVVIPCLLDGDGMVDAIDCAAFCGRIVMYGCVGICNKPIDFYKVHRKRLELYSTEPRKDVDNRLFLHRGIQLVHDGLVNTMEMITHKLPLENIADAFALRDDKTNDAIHVLVDCE